MPPIFPLSLSDEHIKRAAEDMIRIHGSKAAATAEEYIDGLNSEGLHSLAKTWEVIREKIRDLQGVDPKPSS